MLFYSTKESSLSPEPFMVRITTNVKINKLNMSNLTNPSSSQMEFQVLWNLVRKKLNFGVSDFSFAFFWFYN